MLHDIDYIDVERIHVKDPFDVILLCGGPYGDISKKDTLSLRDAFLKTINIGKYIGNKSIVQAEDITRKFGFTNFYNDILSFEEHIAQIVDLVILFCESEGSLTELGAFSMSDDIVDRLFIIILEKHWTEESFIKLGPLKRIENKIGRSAIQVINHKEIGIERAPPHNINKEKMMSIIEKGLKNRLSLKKEPTTFNKNKPGHIIKLISWMIQEYGALTFEEIREIINKFNLTTKDTDLRGYLLCAQAVNWIHTISKGSHDYYVPTANCLKNGQDAADIHMKDGVSEKNKQRRRTNIRTNFEKNDPTRYAVIQQSLGIQ